MKFLSKKMKPYQQRLSIFLILLLGLSLTSQYKLEQSKDSKIGDIPKNPASTATSQQNGNKLQKDKVKDNISISLKNEQQTAQRTSKIESQGKASIYTGASEWSYGGSQIYFLDRHTVDCKLSNSAINMFKFEVSSTTDDPSTSVREDLGKKIRYSYKCVKSPAISDSCRDFSTTPNRVFFFEVTKAIKKLNRHYLECPDNMVMKKFGLKSSGIFELGNTPRSKIAEDDYPMIWYDYTCCNAQISRETYFETNMTQNPESRYFNLRNQIVNCKDFNALSAFNFQCPENKIFYSAKIQILKDEVSPGFPDPCLKSSQNLRAEESSKNEAGNKSKVYLGKYVYFN